jgi:hypothetical protein
VKTYRIVLDEISGDYFTPDAELTEDGEYSPDDLMPSGYYVPAEVAERLYKALTRLRDAASECGGTFSISHEHRAAYEAAEAALKFADGETPEESNAD